MPNYSKIAGSLSELLAKLPKGSTAAQEAIRLEMELEAARQAALYAPHTLPTETGAAALEQAKKTLGKADGGAAEKPNAWHELIGFQGKTRAGTPASPTPLDEQLGRTTARIKGFMNDPEAELKRMVYQYLPASGDSPEEQERKLNELAMGFAGTTTGKTPKMSKAQAIESGLYHPVGAGKKLARPVSEVEFTRVPDPNMPMAPRKVITPEDLYKKQGYPVPWDASAAGELLTGMGGKLFEEPVVLQGGIGYQRTHGGSHSPQKLAVASQPGIITRHSNIIKRIASEGDDPVSVVLAMSPGHGLDYNKMLANTLVQQLKNAKIPSKLAKEFDEEIRSAHPNFVGVKSKKLEEQLNADTSGELRKTFAKRMTLDQFQKGGFPDVVEARVAISTPEMLNAPVGSGGLSFGLMDPAGGVVKEAVNPHHTYKAASPGEYYGGMDVGFSAEELFPEFHEQRRLLGADPKDDWYAFGRTMPTQRFDQEWLDKIMPLYERRMKELTGKKEGGLAEGGVPEKRDVSQLFPLKVPADNAELKPEPKYPLLEKASQGVQSIHDFVSAPFGYENPAGEMVSSFLGVPAVAKTMENIAYGTPLTTGSGMTTNLRPETAEAAMAVAPLVRPAVKTGTKVGKALAPTAAEMALDIASKYGVDPRMNIIKPKGGNFLAGTPENSTNKLKTKYGASKFAQATLDEMNEVYNPEALALMSEETREGVTRHFPALQREATIEKWIDKKLNPYIKNEMGTEVDPIRLGIERRAAEAEKLKEANQARLAKMEADIAKAKARGKDTTLSENDLERAREKFADEEYIATEGLFHGTSPAEGWGGVANEGSAGFSEGLRGKRERAGVQSEPLGTHPASKKWERTVDAEMRVAHAKHELKNPNSVENNSWLAKVDPESNVYSLDSYADVSFEFRHMIDELKEAMNPETVLPKSLRITPKDLEKMTVDDVSALSGKISAWRNVQKTKADLEIANKNPATHIFKEYTENNPKGLSWRQIKLPDGLPEEEAKKAVREATRYEGNMMRHCVGGAGHCEPLLRGDVELYTLRDAKGEPHVTIEVEPNKYAPRHEEVQKYMALAEQEAKKLPNGYTSKDIEDIAIDMAKKAMPPRILEIKGKNNQKPKPEYIPFVQDFIKSGKWSEIRDMHHTDLYDVAHPSLKDFIPQSFDASASDRMIAIVAARRAGELRNGLMTREEWEPIVQKYLPQNKAHGGAVRMAEGGAVNSWQQMISSDYNTNPDMKDGGSFVQAPAFAKGGAVNNAWINLIEGAQNA